ncbi:MAG TPA: ABC transporter permease, partial [Cupriavidus sp.]|nr:ABC transporter permease [Cupriavidus sp.]
MGAATLEAFRLLGSGDGALWFIVWTSLMVAGLGLALATVPAIGAA